MSSSNNSNHDEDFVTGLKRSLGQLDVQRQSLELESEAIVSELTQKPESGGEPMGIDTPLVDAEGFPRGDIDLYRARTLRQRLAVIKTDHKALMKQIDTLLVQIAAAKNPEKVAREKEELARRTAPKPKPKYDAKTGKWVVKNWDDTIAGVPDGDQRKFDSLNAPAQSSSQQQSATNGIQSMTIDSSNNTTTNTPLPTSPPPTTPPFAKINSVALQSPAAEAGLQQGDLVLQFGTISADNHDNLRALPPLVSAAADQKQSIGIWVQRSASESRQSTKIQLRLSPKPWPGRGLLGCHIVPYIS